MFLHDEQFNHDFANHILCIDMSWKRVYKYRNNTPDTSLRKIKNAMAALPGLVYKLVAGFQTHNKLW